MNVHECFTEIHKVNDICVMEKEEEKKEKKTIRTHTSTDSLIHEIVYGMVWSYGIECMKESRYTQIQNGNSENKKKRRRSVEKK